MSDLIERARAIEIIHELQDSQTFDQTADMAYDLVDWAISEIPSAQPEIIRCNDCKHWTQTTGNMRGFGLGDCDYINAKLVNCNGFCYWAERRTDG